MIGTIIGHKGDRRSATSGYVHHADAVLLAAADVISRRILQLLGEAKRGVVVKLSARSA